jgi:hypothetical protein
MNQNLIAEWRGKDIPMRENGMSADLDKTDFSRHGSQDKSS